MKVHSIESLGAVDGPGLRFVVFLPGCPLRCRYCHNPDAQAFDGGEEVTLDELRRRIERMRSYFGASYAPGAARPTGGVTVSGGDPLARPDDAAALVALCHELGVHVALDTAAGWREGEAAAALAVAARADLLILDIKHPDAGKCRQLTGRGNEGAFRLLAAAQARGQPVWIRHVAVPGFTDEATVRALAAALKPYPCVERVDLLGFHRLGEEKYAALKRPYPMGDTPDFGPVELARLRQILHAKTVVQ